MLRAALQRTEDVPLFEKKEPDDPIIPTSVKVPQSLVEKIDWIAQRQGESRAYVIELALKKLVETYEGEEKLTVGRIPLGTKKKAHRTSPKARTRK